MVDELSDWLMDSRFTGEVVSLDLLSGWSCPFAEACLSKVHEIAGEFTKAGNPKRQLRDGDKTEHRCYSASQEVIFPAVYDRRKSNYESLKECSTVEEMVELLENTLPRNAAIVRQHVGGDFFNEMYFLAWLKIAERNPSILFYGYTKSLNYWVDNMELVNSLPNVVLTASRGGRLDSMIAEYNLREAVVVFSEQQAVDLGLEIDHDDSHAARPDLRHQSFALLIHGVQPKGSEAAKALVALKGKGSYQREKSNVGK
jgi:hypothetical protein